MNLMDSRLGVLSFSSVSSDSGLCVPSFSSVSLSSASLVPVILCEGGLEQAGEAGVLYIDIALPTLQFLFQTIICTLGITVQVDVTSDTNK